MWVQKYGGTKSWGEKRKRKKSGEKRTFLWCKQGKGDWNAEWRRGGRVTLLAGNVKTIKNGRQSCKIVRPPGVGNQQPRRKRTAGKKKETTRTFLGQARPGKGQRTSKKYVRLCIYPSSSVNPRAITERIAPPQGIVEKRGNSERLTHEKKSCQASFAGTVFGKKDKELGGKR